jgi:phage protein D
MGTRGYTTPKLVELSTLEYRQKIEARKVELERKLKARRGKTAFADNVPQIEAEIAKHERLLASLDDPTNIA